MLKLSQSSAPQSGRKVAVVEILRQNILDKVEQLRKRSRLDQPDKDRARAISKGMHMQQTNPIQTRAKAFLMSILRIKEKGLFAFFLVGLTFYGNLGWP